VPIMTILISNMGDTIIYSYRRGSLLQSGKAEVQLVHAFAQSMLGRSFLRSVTLTVLQTSAVPTHHVQSSFESCILRRRTSLSNFSSPRDVRL
jgi:hypothetical protein